jgi:uncharacterized protein YndB with AHSA1/START domain
MSESTKRQHTGREVRREIEIDAAPEAVYEAWADPNGFASWFIDRAEGRAEAGSTVMWFFEAFGFELPVQIYEAEPGRRILMGGESPVRASLLEVVIEQAGGGSKMTLVDSGFGEGADWDEEYEGVDSGWALALATLKHWLENYRGRRRTHEIVMQPTALEYDALQPYFTTSEGLASWLAAEARADEPLAPGRRVAMTLADGSEFDGVVLARTRREVLLSWPQADAVLGLKCFSAGPAGRMVALDFNAWPAEGASRDVRGLLGEALGRLASRPPEA